MEGSDGAPAESRKDASGLDPRCEFLKMRKNEEKLELRSYDKILRTRFSWGYEDRFAIQQRKYYVGNLFRIFRLMEGQQSLGSVLREGQGRSQVGEVGKSPTPPTPKPKNVEKWFYFRRQYF